MCHNLPGDQRNLGRCFAFAKDDLGKTLPEFPVVVDRGETQRLRNAGGYSVNDLLHRGAEVDARSDKGKTALHYAATYGHVEAVKLLLENGALVDARDRDGHTPLMFAAIYGCNHTIQALINGGADPRAKTLVGNTAMIYAENNNHPIALALLKKAQRMKEASNKQWAGRR